MYLQQRKPSVSFHSPGFGGGFGSGTGNSYGGKNCVIDNQGAGILE